MAYQLILFLHIACGSISLIAGLLTLVVAKGSPLHIKVGLVFFWAMLAMGIVGLVLATINPNAFFIITGLFVIYLVLTGRHSAQRKEDNIGNFERFAFAFVLLLAVGTSAVGIWGLIRQTNLSDLPAEIYLGIAFEGFVFAFLDARKIIKKNLTGLTRIIDHLWRMIMALIFAATAFFVANVEILPDPFQSPLVHWTPIALLFLLLVYWLIRLKKVNFIFARRIR